MNRHLGYERVYLPLYKGADTHFHVQGDDNSLTITNNELAYSLHSSNYNGMVTDLRYKISTSNLASPDNIITAW